MIFLKSHPDGMSGGSGLRLYYLPICFVKRKGAFVLSLPYSCINNMAKGSKKQQ
jgi:hypothetical protein